MDEFLNKLSFDQLALITAVLIYVTKEIANFVKHSLLKTKTLTEENTDAIKALIIEIKYLDKRLESVETSIDKFTELKSTIWKLEKDVGFAHEKIRDISKQT